MILSSSLGWRRSPRHARVIIGTHCHLMSTLNLEAMTMRTRAAASLCHLRAGTDALMGASEPRGPRRRAALRVHVLASECSWQAGRLTSAQRHAAGASTLAIYRQAWHDTAGPGVVTRVHTCPCVTHGAMAAGTSPFVSPPRLSQQPEKRKQIPLGGFPSAAAAALHA